MSFTPAEFPLQHHLGMTIEVPEDGRSVARVTVEDHLRNPNGVVHGAVLFAMADTGMGAATMSILGDDQICASIEVHLRFLRAVADGEIICETTVLRSGQRIVQLESELRDASGELVASATGSFAVLSPRA